jgi:hypothetical protein
VLMPPTVHEGLRQAGGRRHGVLRRARRRQAVREGLRQAGEGVHGRTREAVVVDRSWKNQR